MASFWNRINTVLLLVVLLVLIGALASQAWGGPLDPPGPPSSTQRNLIFQPSSCGGFPIILSATGSYQLAQNITIPDGCANDGIDITADNVTLDLGGFALTGAAAGAIGINEMATHVGATIRNGTVQGWPTGDISGDGMNTIDGVRALNSLGYGISVGDGSDVRNCLAGGNHATGVYAAGKSVSISHCVVTGSTGGFVFGVGIYVNGGGSRVEGNDIYLSTIGVLVGNFANTIADNTVSYATGDGIQVAGGDNHIERNSVEKNLGYGIQLGVSATNNVVEGNAASENTQSGIVVFGNSNIIQHNSAIKNGNIGINVGGTKNVSASNTAAQNTNANYVAFAGDDSAPQQTAAAATNPVANVSD